MSHGLSLGCSSGVAGPMAAVCAALSPAGLQGLPELIELLCGNCGTRQVQSSPFLLCSVSPSCLTRSSFCYPYCSCRCCPSCQLLRAGCCQLSWCFCLSYLWSLGCPSLPGAGPSFADQIQPMASFQPAIRKTAQLHSLPYGARLPGTPPPHQSYIH